MDSLERLTPNISSLPKNNISRVMWEASYSICLATLLSCIATFFVATLQLFFALKIAKSNPGSSTLYVLIHSSINQPTLFRALQYLQDGKLVRLPTFFIFFLTILLFILTNVASLILIPTPLSILPRGVSCAVGVTLCVFCAATAFHSLHTLFRLDSTANGDRFEPSALSRANQHYSTLV
jgi:hypothetical protein